MCEMGIYVHCRCDIGGMRGMKHMKTWRTISIILFGEFLAVAIYCWWFIPELNLSLETIARRPLYLVLSIVFLAQAITVSAILRDCSKL